METFELGTTSAGRKKGRHYYSAEAHELIAEYCNRLELEDADEEGLRALEAALVAGGGDVPAPRTLGVPGDRKFRAQGTVGRSWHRRPCWWIWCRHFSKEKGRLPDPEDPRDWPPPIHHPGPKTDLGRGYVFTMGHKSHRKSLAQLLEDHNAFVQRFPKHEGKTLYEPSTVTRAIATFIARSPAGWSWMLPGRREVGRLALGQANRHREYFVRLREELKPLIDSGARDPLILRFAAFGMLEEDIPDVAALTGVSVGRIRGLTLPPPRVRVPSGRLRYRDALGRARRPSAEERRVAELEVLGGVTP